MTLRDAVEYYWKQEKAISNSYEWYRKSAKNFGEISIGGMQVPVHRLKGRWHVDEKTFHNAIQEHLVQVSHFKKVTEDYSKGIIYGGDGDTIHTEWGGYQIHGIFRFVWSDLERRRMKNKLEQSCPGLGLGGCAQAEAPADSLFIGDVVPPNDRLLPVLSGVGPFEEHCGLSFVQKRPPSTVHD